MFRYSNVYKYLMNIYSSESVIDLSIQSHIVILCVCVLVLISSEYYMLVFAWVYECFTVQIIISEICNNLRTYTSPMNGWFIVEAIPTLHQSVNKYGECEFQLISNLFDVFCIQVTQTPLFTHCGETAKYSSVFYWYDWACWIPRNIWFYGQH